MISTLPCCHTPTHEYVVPKSMPTAGILLIFERASPPGIDCRTAERTPKKRDDINNICYAALAHGVRWCPVKEKSAFGAGRPVFIRYARRGGECPPTPFIDAPRPARLSSCTASARPHTSRRLFNPRVTELSSYYPVNGQNLTARREIFFVPRANVVRQSWRTSRLYVDVDSGIKISRVRERVYKYIYIYT